MARPCNKPLKANPFMARRDSQTGRWQVVKAPASKRENVVKKNLNIPTPGISKPTFLPLRECCFRPSVEAPGQSRMSLLCWF